VPPNEAPGTAREWLDRARGKLVLAKQPLPPGGYREDLCYMAQQAAELAIKAVYQQHGLQFPFIHDLGQLLDGLEARSINIPEAVQNADELTVYATQARYPGITGPVSQTDYEQAFGVAESVVVWAEKIVK